MPPATRFDESATDRFTKACHEGDLDGISSGLANRRVEVNCAKGYPLALACESGNVRAVKLLLASRRVKVTDRHLRGAMGTERDRADVLQLCLGRISKPLVTNADFSVAEWEGDLSALWWACRQGNVKCVEVLLADGRLDPSADDCAVVALAESHGHGRVVDLLRADPRVPAAPQKGAEEPSEGPSDARPATCGPVFAALRFAWWCCWPMGGCGAPWARLDEIASLKKG